jgi:hypothetical protein
VLLVKDALRMVLGEDPGHRLDDPLLVADQLRLPLDDRSPKSAVLGAGLDEDRSHRIALEVADLLAVGECGERRRLPVHDEPHGHRIGEAPVFDGGEGGDPTDSENRRPFLLGRLDLRPWFHHVPGPRLRSAV